MHTPDDPAKDREREKSRLRQRENRKRKPMGIVTFPGRAPPEFLDAMIARAKFYGVSEREAERDAIDKKKIAALAFEALRYFAAHWYEYVRK